MSIFNSFFDWSEVWAILIPLLMLFKKRTQPVLLKPIIIYLVIAFVLNLAADVIADFKRFFPAALHNNLLVYNLHSIIRFACFSWFFLKIENLIYPRLQSILIGVYAILFIANFTLIESFLNKNHLSGNLLVLEAFLLFISCMAYYLALLKNENEDFRKSKAFWVATGISIYFVINFFVFLFYVPMVDEQRKMAAWLWNFHNIAYITLCIFFAKAFYVPAGN